jgi:hypothetical protein
MYEHAKVLFGKQGERIGRRKERGVAERKS